MPADRLPAGGLRRRHPDGARACPPTAWPGSRPRCAPSPPPTARTGASWSSTAAAATCGCSPRTWRSAGNSALFSGYFEPYVDQVWSKYASTDLRIDTQYTWGAFTGRVSGNTLTFPGAGSFAKPSTLAIFSAATRRSPPATT
nr:beta-1,3-glucanase family protein [Kitasatospora fiedleri]